MLKAKYLGIDDGGVLSGRVYKISTKCAGDKLVVSVSSQKLAYRNLEQFLKVWKIEAVYHG